MTREKPPPWLWACVAVGAAVRLFLALAAAGTDDVFLWTSHAAGVAREGLVPHYASAPLFNHPPPMSLVMAWLWELSQSWGVAFGKVYRVPIALVDLGSAALLWIALERTGRRAIAVAAYCVAPAALVLAGQHGNTDPILGFCLLACVLLASKERAVLAGLLIGVTSWIKLPGLLAAPAIGFALPRWRDRFVCAGVALLVFALGYGFAFVEAERLPGANPLVERVFAFRGLHIGTQGHPPIFVWGLKNFLLPLLGPNPEAWPGLFRWWWHHNHHVAQALIVAFAFLRRHRRSTLELGATVAFSYAIFYGVVDVCSFQYFAWSMALWLLATPMFAIAAHLFVGGYLYFGYAYFTDDWLLLGRWDLHRHSTWPLALKLLRDASLLTFLVFGLGAFARALRDEVSRRDGVLQPRHRLLLAGAVAAAAAWLAWASSTTVEDSVEQALMKAGLEARHVAGDPFAATVSFRQVLARSPEHYGANYQLAAALDAAGRGDEARPYWAKSLALAERWRDAGVIAAARKRLAASDTVDLARVMKQGTDALYLRRDAATAEDCFRYVLAHHPSHYGATYQLATALDRLGRVAEASRLWTDVLAMAEKYEDLAVAEHARRRLAGASP